MKKIVTIFVLVLGLFPLTTNAQSDFALKADTVTGLRHYTSGDNWFVTLHGGLNLPLGENVRLKHTKDVLGVGGGFSVGKYFSPQVGARLYVAYLNQHGRANQEAIDAYPQAYGDGIYKFHNVNTYIDALFNFSNIFAPYSETRRFNVIGIIGLGANWTGGFDKDKLNKWAALPDGPYPTDMKNHGYFALRAGLGFNVMLSKHFDLGLEATMHATDDGYNGVRYRRRYDGYATAMLGLTYHFKDHYGDARFKYRRLSDAEELDEMNRKINDARADLNNIHPETKTEGIQTRILDMTISFIIDKYDITDIQKKNVEAVANYIKSHDDVNLVVTGYADVQTAYPAYNLKLSERRAKAVYNMLVNDYGVDPARLSIDYKGDTVQPYQRKNEWNRVVIFVIKPRN
ncbi:MAG: OmpA family protein [Phocaeicola sp.]|uniref:OmpA family protein n=1 Tax=Phocaeicola TaxID=909656 RepID=UPI00234E7947|nr:OmpA family protein [Phocaeicola oris]MCE2617217.1 OmpA family protein [Phocaeicola oris]